MPLWSSLRSSRLRDSGVKWREASASCDIEFGNDASINRASMRGVSLTSFQKSSVSAVSELNAMVALPYVTIMPTVGTMWLTLTAVMRRCATLNSTPVLNGTYSMTGPCSFFNSEKRG